MGGTSIIINAIKYSHACSPENVFYEKLPLHQEKFKFKIFGTITHTAHNKSELDERNLINSSFPHSHFAVIHCWWLLPIKRRNKETTSRVVSAQHDM